MLSSSTPQPASTFEYRMIPVFAKLQEIPKAHILVLQLLQNKSIIDSDMWWAHCYRAPESITVEEAYEGSCACKAAGESAIEASEELKLMGLKLISLS